jgi:endonuclease/exonuclease/phosphatase family metal-dependent hydrolase
MALQDAWQRAPERPGYTHYSVTGATRIDRIYATRDVIGRKHGLETVAAAFTDHLAVCLRITIDVPIMRLGRG